MSKDTPLCRHPVYKINLGLSKLYLLHLHLIDSVKRRVHIFIDINNQATWTNLAIACL